MTTLGLLLFMPSAALTTNINRRCDQAAALLVAHARRQLGLVDAEGAPFMVDEAAGPKFRNSQETGALKVSRLWAASTDPRDIRVER